MMTQRHRARSVLVVLAMIVQVAWRSSANGSDSHNSFLVSVFDCYMPVPNGFVLNTQDTTGFSLFLRDAFEATRIKISPYSADLGASFTELEKRDQAGLVVEELQNSIRKDIRITRIHDKTQQVVIYGGKDELIDMLIQGCISNKHGKLFTE